MQTIKKIIELETLGLHEKAFEVALYCSRDSFNLYQEYKNFNDSLDSLLNLNGIT